MLNKFQQRADSRAGSFFGGGFFIRGALETVSRFHTGKKKTIMVHFHGFNASCVENEREKKDEKQRRKNHF